MICLVPLITADVDTNYMSGKASDAAQDFRAVEPLIAGETTTKGLQLLRHRAFISKGEPLVSEIF